MRAGLSMSRNCSVRCFGRVGETCQLVVFGLLYDRLFITGLRIQAKGSTNKSINQLHHRLSWSSYSVV